MKRIYIIYFALISLLSVGCGKSAMVLDYDIVPEPASLTMQEGSFTFSKKTKIYFENLGQNNSTSEYILRTLRKMHLRPGLSGIDLDNCVAISLFPADSQNAELGDEGYQLEVTARGIYITANTETGLFYGFQTLLQMLPADINQQRYRSVSLPLCSIVDYPRFSWRGSLRDVSRHFFTVADIKKHLDLMAMYKLNKFHWHLTDDHGWRIEIDKYPGLNDIASWRVDRDNVPWGQAEPARDGEPRTYGGFYTKEEIREIVDYAAHLHIDVIPEIEIPGHCAAILEAYPQFACADDDTTYQIQIGPYWPPRAILCGGNDSVMQFLFDIMDEVCELFPYEYIHIGGDEATKDNWRRCHLCQSRIHSLRLNGEEGLQSWMIRQVEQHLSAKGKRIIGWDEILDGGVSPSATVMVWRGEAENIVGGEVMNTRQRVVKAAQMGNSVILTPVDHCYHNFYQANPDHSIPAQPGLITLRQAYLFNPTAGLTKAQAQCVLGGQSNLWAEYINTTDNAELKLLPRMLATAERLWSPDHCCEWPHFRAKVQSHSQRLTTLGYQVGTSSFKPEITITRADRHVCRVVLDYCQEGTEIYYTLNGDDPTPQSARYVEPFLAPAGSTLRTASYYQGQLQEEIYTFEIK